MQALLLLAESLALCIAPHSVSLQEAAAIFIYGSCMVETPAKKLLSGSGCTPDQDDHPPRPDGAQGVALTAAIGQPFTGLDRAVADPKLSAGNKAYCSTLSQPSAAKGSAADQALSVSAHLNSELQSMDSTPQAGLKCRALGQATSDGKAGHSLKPVLENGLQLEQISQHPFWQTFKNADLERKFVRWHNHQLQLVTPSTAVCSNLIHAWCRLRIMHMADLPMA